MDGKTNSKWHKSGGLSGNSILPGDGFFISYLPPGGMMFAGFMNSDGGEAETAIVSNGKYYILNGDFRKQYEKLVSKGLKACLAFYKKNKKHKASSWSD